MTDAAISVRNLWKVYGPKPDRIVDAPEAMLPRTELTAKSGNVVAIGDVSFDVAPGEVFVVMGLSGSGKSTLVRCLTNLIPATAGSIVVGGTNVTTASPIEMLRLRRHQVSMVFQHFGLLPHRTLIDNVGFGLEVRGDPKDTIRRKAEEALDLVGLGGLGTRRPDQLSGGMQQRVGLARALATNPEVLLLDEPFSALDPLIRREMQDEILRLQRELKKTMVFITHDLSEALRLGQRIAVMRDGRFVQVGTPGEIVMSPADAYVRDFVRDVPRSHVVTVGSIVGPAAAECCAYVDEEAKVRDVVRHVASSDLPVGVRDASGSVVGSVDRRAVLSVIAGEAAEGTELAPPNR